MRSRRTYKNSVISSPPILSVILTERVSGKDFAKDIPYLDSEITRPSSTHAILEVTAPMSTTHALLIPAP